MHLYFFAPYSQERRLGEAYNECMTLLPDDEDWACLCDGDVMFLTPDYGRQIMEIIQANPTMALFTCVTNRIGCRLQLHQQKISDDPNILNHRRIAFELQRDHRLEVEPIKGPISGFVLVLKKSVWKQLKFSERLHLLHVDWEYTERLTRRGFAIGLMKGVYVFHFYRLEKGAGDVSHLV